MRPSKFRFDVEATATEIITEMVTATTDRLAQDGVTDPSEQYRILTIAVGLTIGAAAGVASNEPLVLDFPALLPFIVVFALYVPFLPFAVLAWIEGDLLADDDGLARDTRGAR